LDALHPRLLTDDFAAAYGFYDAVLPKVAGAVRSAGGPEGPYASWDVDGQGILALLARPAFTAMTGLSAAAPASGAVMLVCRVDTVDEAAQVCVGSGATLVGPPADRPEWGPTLRTAYLRDPDGTLIELQSY
jgi:predicted enzyme related to lactoylglutathione lyase